MKNLWNDQDAAACGGDFLRLRVYTSRLLGRDPALVLHGGGNTSVKADMKNLYGEAEPMLFVKGSGWDLATLEPAGLVPVKLEPLKRAVTLPALSDTDMVRLQRAAMPDPALPAPSVEAILHAIIPYAYVDHTHADALVTLTNTPQGEALIRSLYGPRVLIVPYVMPGFVLAKKVYELTRTLDWEQTEGLILLNHGIFTFGSTARKSYDQMIKLVTQAETYLQEHAPLSFSKPSNLSEDLPGLARLRKAVSRAHGSPVLACLDTQAASRSFADHPAMPDFARRGPLTPDHVIRTKPAPVVLTENLEACVEGFVQAYQAYFARNTSGALTCLNPAPCWGVWPGQGTVVFGETLKETAILSDLIAHTLPAILGAERLGGWTPVSEADAFAVEYWELEQAKLKHQAMKREFQGKIVLVTGAAGGIGRACVEAFHGLGAAVAALDIDPALNGLFKQPGILECVGDVTRAAFLRESVEKTVRRFGGLDVLVCNAGIFPPSEPLESLSPENWERSLAVNLSSQQALLQLCIPFLSLGLDPAVVMLASKNVPAPGPGAGAYSVAKAGLTQLARVAALELAPKGIRVNVLHPNAVFDTKLWTPEVLEARAKHYGMSVQAYKTNNLLRTEITSADVARLACVLAGPAFSKTTGAQIPVDGGNDRVI